VVENQDYNKMNVQNLGIVFGPTLMGTPVISDPSIPPSLSGVSGPLSQNDGIGLNDMGWQCKVVETILMNYRSIFVMD